MSYAVVDYNGLLNRGTAGTTVTRAGGGCNVKFPTAVKTCAFLANVADPGNGLVYNPAVVETSSSTDANTV